MQIRIQKEACEYIKKKNVEACITLGFQVRAGGICAMPACGLAPHIPWVKLGRLESPAEMKEVCVDGIAVFCPPAMGEYFTAVTVIVEGILGLRRLGCFSDEFR